MAKSLLAVGLFASLAEAAFAQELSLRFGKETAISTAGTDNHNPAVAIVSESQVFAVWESRLSNGNRRIVFREQIAGEWLPPVFIDRDPAGDNRLPVLGTDAFGRPHVAWIANVNGKRRPVYATRSGSAGNASVWISVSVPDPDSEELVGSCDFVNLRIDDSGNPWLAWQCGYGSAYAIVASTLMPLGSMESFNLTPHAVSHNLFPEIILADVPVIAWYAAQNQTFELDARRFVRPSEWLPHRLSDLDGLPAESFPNVFQDGNGPLSAVWYDRPMDEPGNSDRIYLGEQSLEDQGRGRVIDDQPEAKNSSATGDKSERAIMATWTSRRRDALIDIILAYGPTPDRMRTTKVNRSEYLSAGNPKVASSNSRVAVIWETDADIGSVEGDIVFREARY